MAEFVFEVSYVAECLAPEIPIVASPCVIYEPIYQYMEVYVLVFLSLSHPVVVFYIISFYSFFQPSTQYFSLNRIVIDILSDWKCKSYNRVKYVLFFPQVAAVIEHAIVVRNQLPFYGTCC